MARVVIADKLDAETVVELKMRYGSVVDQPSNLDKELSDAEILVVRSRTQVTKDLLAKAPKLRVVARAGVGLDNIDLRECERRGIKVVNTPDASTIAVAELAVGLMISLLRRIPRADSTMKQKRWEKESLLGRELHGKTVGIIGFGRVGAAVAERLRSFGCKIIACSPHFKGTDWVESVSLEELLKRSDIVTLHAPLNEKTRGMIGKQQIEMMKPSAILVNTARGALVDEEALYEALKKGRISGAALDVYTSEPYSGKLCELENVVLTPHLGGNTVEGQERIGKQLIEELEKIG
jgi:D-3-phosphoglycerate dehydrogenase